MLPQIAIGMRLRNALEIQMMAAQYRKVGRIPGIIFKQQANRSIGWWRSPAAISAAAWCRLQVANELSVVTEQPRMAGLDGSIARTRPVRTLSTERCRVDSVAHLRAGAFLMRKGEHPSLLRAGCSTCHVQSIAAVLFPNSCVRRCPRKTWSCSVSLGGHGLPAQPRARTAIRHELRCVRNGRVARWRLAARAVTIARDGRAVTSIRTRTTEPEPPPHRAIAAAPKHRATFSSFAKAIENRQPGHRL